MDQFMQNNNEINNSLNKVRLIIIGLKKSMSGKEGLLHWETVMNSLPKELKQRIIDVAKEYESEQQTKLDELWKANLK